MRKATKTSLILAVLLVVSMISTIMPQAITGNTVYSNLKLERVHDLENIPVNSNDYLFEPDENTNTTYTNTSGMAIGKSHDSLFVIKSNDDITKKAKLLYFPNFSVSDTCAVLDVDYAGHANGMAIDDNNIYLTASSNIPSAIESHDDHYILKIPRTVIHNKALIKLANTNQDVLIEEDDPSIPGADGFTWVPFMIGNITTNQPTGAYTGTIGRITCYNGNGSFIVNYAISNNTNYYYKNTAYTRAKLTTYNGNEILLLSNSTSDIFVIRNNIQNQPSFANANIMYSSECGFFDPKFIQTTVDNYGRRTKNVVLWADIDSTPNTYVTIGNNNYRCFYADKINLNTKNDYNSLFGSSNKMYYQFEIESMAFDENNDLFLAANVKHTRSSDDSPYYYHDAYKAYYGEAPIGDGVFKLTRYAATDTSQSTPLGWEL